MTTTDPTAAPAISPATTALLLMDFQPAILGSIAEAQTVLAQARRALAWARAGGVQVVFVRVAFADEDYMAIPAHNKAFSTVAAMQILRQDAPETQIHDALEVRDTDIVVRKIRFGAFSTTDLYANLHAKGIDTLVVAGLSTSGVVLSTLRDAADADYRLFVLADATADPDPEVHRVLIEKVFPNQADIITVADLPA